MAACCPRKRSPNDALRDPEDGRSYCGNCWQAWLGLNSKRKSATPALSPPASDPLPSPTAPETFDDDAAGELVAALSDDATFLLTSPKLKLVFAAERLDGRLVRVGTLSSSGSVVLDAPPTPDTPLPFAVNAADHCETPATAYADIAPVLSWLAASLGKTEAKLAIYDPYFCDGGVKRRLGALGFRNVYHEREDFYAVRDAGTVPEYDVLVTNPPYKPCGGVDHVEELLGFVGGSGHPFFILQPNYVYTKAFYEGAVRRLGTRPFYLTPPLPRSYVYETPEGLRDVKAAQRKTSPFVTFWYGWVGELQGKFVKDWAKGKMTGTRLEVVMSEYFLGDGFKDSADKTRKRNRGKKRLRDKGSVDAP